MSKAAKNITGECYLVLERLKRRSYDDGHEIKVAGVTKNRPSLGRQQVAIRVRLSVSQSLFEDTFPDVQIGIEEEHIITPTVEVTPEQEQPND